MIIINCSQLRFSRFGSVELEMPPDGYADACRTLITTTRWYIELGSLLPEEKLELETKPKTTPTNNIQIQHTYTTVRVHSSSDNR